MANNPWTMEAANLFCGSDPTTSASNHLSLTDIKLPMIDINYVDHRPGGSPVALEVDVQVNKLSCSFALVGVTPQVMGLVQALVWTSNIFTMYGVIRDQVTGQAAQAAAQMWGQLGHVEPTNWTRGAVLRTQYAIRSIMHYELVIAGQQIYYWHFPTNTFNIGQGANTGVSTLTNISDFAPSN